MKGTQLGEFEEIVLLTVAILDDQAYGISIKDEIEDRTGRKISIGGLHSTITRLEEKGFLTSELGGATSERGGRRKRFFKISYAGKLALNRAKNLRDDLWKSAKVNLAVNIGNGKKK